MAANKVAHLRGIPYILAIRAHRPGAILLVLFVPHSLSNCIHTRQQFNLTCKKMQHV